LACVTRGHFITIKIFPKDNWGGARARAQGYPGASHGCLSEFRPKFVVSVGKLQLPVRLSFKPMTPLDQTVIKELNPL